MNRLNSNYTEKRQMMMDRQLIPRGIRDSRVLEAFNLVPRENFVPEKSKFEAYYDAPSGLMLGQTISQPYIVAYMTELLGVSYKKNKILEVGTGSGYQAAILAAMGFEVISIERHPELADFAAQNLKTVPYGRKVEIHVGDGCLGWPEDSPFDGILVTAAAPKIPPALKNQLRIGGKLVIPCGNRFIQDMLIISRISESEFDTEKGCGCRFVPLIGEGSYPES